MPMTYPLRFPVVAAAARRRMGRLALKHCLVLGFGVLCLGAAQARDIDYVDARFSVEYNGKLTEGESRLNIRRKGDQYQVEFSLDHWLLSSSQKATFEMHDCQVRPESYVSASKAPFKGETVQALDFDWAHKQARYTKGGEHKTFSLESPLYDPLSFFFEARCALEAGKTEVAYPLIYKGREAVQAYKVVGTEKISTGMGEVQALVVERQRKSKTRKTRLYVAPSLDYLLVRISHQESRLVKVVATLKSMDYRMVDE